MSVTKSTPKLKNIPTVIALAMIPGIIGLMGIGHIYIGRIARGIVILIIGIIIFLLAIVRFQYALSLASESYRHIATTIYATSIIDLVIWGWQIQDAYHLALEYNRLIQETGRAPW